jgi:phage-related protein
MKQIVFLGDSLACLRDFPDLARAEAGYQLNEVQNGHNPRDWKPMKTIGSGVREIRIRDGRGAFRVIYVANTGSVILVLHAFQKKSQNTSQTDLDLAKARLNAWKG